ncbi:MAG: tetratricopeptide repeat protein [Planctomycetota bacterium]|jgi:tetratricopeptide (TPR) repeat protein
MRISILAIALMFAGEAYAERLIILRDGSVFHGTVLDSSWESVKVKRKLPDGSEKTIEIPVEDCDSHFFYSVRDKAVGDDAKERIQLAKFCVSREMYSRAKAQMDQARSIDPAVVEEFMKTRFPEIKEKLADKLLKAGERALRRGSTKNAKKYASVILTKFEDTKAEPGAEKLLADAQAKLAEIEAKKRAQRRRSQKADEERAARQEEARRDGILDPIEKLMDRANEANERGLRAKNASEYREAFGRATERYERAAKLAAKALEADEDEEMKKHLEEMRAESIEGAVHAYLNWANNLSARGSYQEAVKLCDKALALDPNNAEIISTRATISTTDGGWTRRRGGRRR